MPSEQIDAAKAIAILRTEIPRDHAISISVFDYRHIHETKIVSGFELARGKRLTETMVKQALREWRKLMRKAIFNANK